MGNCNQCLSQNPKVVKKSRKAKQQEADLSDSDHSIDLNHLSCMSISANAKNIGKKFTRIIYEDAFPESGSDEIQSMLQSVDPEQILTFQVHLRNFKLQNINSNLNQEMYLTTEVGEDIIEKKHALKKQQTILKMDKKHKILEAELNPQNLLSSSKGNADRENEIRLSEKWPQSTDQNNTQWESKQFRIGLEGSYDYMESDNHFKFETEVCDIRKQYFILRLCQKTAGTTRKTVSYISVEFLAVALGPKKYDLEIRDLKSGKSIGRIQFELDVKQYQTMGINLLEIQCSLNGKEERALYSQFKVISNNDIPKISDSTKTLVGRFKKDKNSTSFKWKHTEEDLYNTPEVHYDIAMETLKNSSIQVVLKVDHGFSEQQTELILKKIKKQANADVRGKTTYNPPSKDQPGSTLGAAMIRHRKGTHNQILKDDMSINSNKYSFGMEEEEEKQNEFMMVSAGQPSISPQDFSATSLSVSAQKQITQPTDSQNNTGGLSGSQNSSLKKTGKRFSSVVAEIKQGFQEFGMKNKRISRQSSQGKDNLSVKFANMKEEQIDILKEGGGSRKASLSIKSNRTSFQTDAAEYYRKYDNEEGPLGNESQSMASHIVGECYLNFSKLLQSEMRQLDKRDSSILQQKMSLSVKKSISIRVKDRERTSLSPTRRFEMSLSMSGKKRKPITVVEKKPFSEQLWHMGKVIGSVKGIFQLQNIPTVQQMQLGILTENGLVLNCAPILMNDDKDGGFLGILKKNNRNEHITALIEATKKLKKIDNLKDKKQIFKAYSEKEAVINDLINILADGDSAMAANGNTRMFKYSNELDMIRGQQAMIELGFHCLLFADNTRYEFKRDYYEMLSQIFLRDELKLTNVALCPELMEVRQSSDVGILDYSLRHQSIKSSMVQSDGQATHNKKETISKEVVVKDRENMQSKRVLQAAEIPKRIDQEFEDLQFERVKQEKVKIAQFYQKLLYQILDDCLIKFCRKDVEPYLRSYLEICISIAFFRVPRFQTLFMDCINSQSQTDQSGQKIEIIEWRNINWDIEDDASSNAEISQGLVKLFDWQLHFYQHIPVSDEYQEAMKYMRRIENNKKWQMRVKKRSLAYFQIIRRWADFIQTTVQTNHLFWQDIPGYRQVVKSIILELKQRSINDYPDSLIDATLELIQNPELLTVMTTIVFAKTNAYDSASLCATMSLLCRWLNHMEKQGLQFPTNFDFNFFLKGITIALEVEHSISTPRTLHLLYRTLHYIPIEQRGLIIQEIYKKFFYKLFFSWSYNIRDLFIALLLYQIEYLYIFRLTNHLTIAIENASIGVDRQTTTIRDSKVRNSSLPYQRSITAHSLSKRSLALGPRASVNLGNPADMTRDQMKMKRRDNFRKFNKVILQYEQQLQQNPNEAEESFDRSVSLKRFRVTSEMLMNQSMKTSQRAIHSSSNFQTRMKDDPVKRVASGFERRKMGQEGLTLSQFIKCHDYYKKFTEEIEVLDEYINLKNSQTIGREMSQISPQIMVRGLEEPGLERQTTGGNSESTADLGHRYKKIMSKIPSNLHVYVPQAIEDFNKHMEDYEHWRHQLVQTGAQNAVFYSMGYNGPVSNQEFAVLNLLPEFNMDKNMPVEDDDNLAKKEEW